MGENLTVGKHNIDRIKEIKIVKPQTKSVEANNEKKEQRTFRQTREMDMNVPGIFWLNPDDCGIWASWC